MPDDLPREQVQPDGQSNQGEAPKVEVQPDEPASSKPGYAELLRHVAAALSVTVNKEIEVTGST
jgi:hypothetical protein